MARNVLADRRAAAETMHLALGSDQIALEPGDHFAIAGRDDVFEITRVADAGTRTLDLVRLRAPADAQLALASPNAPPTPEVAPTPALSVLDLPLPLLPGAEGDERPLAALFASPWLGDLEIDVDISTALATKRATIPQPATMGELLWALWPGPLDRWDNGNVVRIMLYGGTLSSAPGDAVLNGANATPGGRAHCAP